MSTRGLRVLGIDDAWEEADAWRRDAKELGQAALELHAEIRAALAWIETKAEPAIAYAALRRTADKWRPLLEGKYPNYGGL
jgi:hypothetical protein